MKRIISYTLIFTLFTGILIPLNIVFGQNQTPPSPLTTGGSVNINTAGNVLTPEQLTTGNNTTANRYNTNSRESTANAKPVDATCNVISPSFTLNGCGNGIIAFFGYLLMSILSLFLRLAGLLLNWTLKYTVMDMAQNLKTMTGINVGWKVIRDLMNIAFIFMLVWEGIQMILGEGSAGAKKLITGVIIASVLINFSLFFTKVLIDASNIVTIGFYNAILGDKDADASVGLSNPIMRSLGLTSFYGTDSIQNFNNQAGSDGTKILILSLGASIIFLIAGFCFLAVAIMFIVRYLTLLLLLITSPIAYMGQALPFMKTYSKQWWETLNSQLLFAPIYMIMTWVVLTLLASPNFTTIGGGNKQFAALFIGTADGSPGTDSISLLLNFAVVIGLLIATLTTAKSFSSKGGGMITSATNWGTAVAGGALMGTAAWAGRNSIGWGALKGTSVEELESQAAKGSVSAKARLAMAKGSYDLRRSRAGEAAQKQLGVNFGKGTESIPFLGNAKAGEGGFAAQKANNKKENEENIDRISKPFIAKRDWAGLAKALKERPSRIKKPLTFDSDWQAQQQALYKKLSGKERVSLENELRNTEKSGLSTDAAESLINSMRSKLPFDDQIKIFTDRKDFEGLADFVEFKDKKEGKDRDKEQQNYIYEKMTPRDRIELDEALTKRAGKPLGVLTSLSEQMRDGLSKEDLEKTVEVGKKAAKEEFNKGRLEKIEELVKKKTGTPEEYDKLFSEFPKKEARNLSVDALKDPNVIQRLPPGHLNDIMSEHDNFNNVKEDMLKVINSTIEIPGIKSPKSTTMYKLQKAQQKWITSNDGIKAQWGIEL